MTSQVFSRSFWKRSRPLVLCAALILGGIAASLFGCRGRSSGAKEVVRFSFWGSFIELQIWEEMERRFETLRPDVDLQLQYAPGEYGRKLRLQFISGTACDVIMVDDEFYPTYCEAGHLLDLGDWIERDREEVGLDEFFPTAMESFTFQGQRCAIPWDGFDMLCYYNQDLFDQTNLPYPKDDWTWEDFERCAIALTQDTDKDGRIDQFGCNLGFGWLDVEPVIWSFGGDILSPDKTRSVLDSPEVVQALSFLRDLKFEHHAMPQVGELSGMAREIQILTGKVAMLQAPAYIISTMRDVQEMNWDVVHMPTGPAGKASRVSWDGLAIYRGSPHQEAAWEFIKLVLSPEGQRSIGTLQRALPVRRSAAEASFVSAKTPQKEEKFLEAMEYGRLTPITTRYAEMQIAMGNELEKLGLGTSDPQSVARSLHKEVNRILSEGP